MTDWQGRTVSDDGKYVWDGNAWQPRTISEDGNYVWDGAAWQLRTTQERGHEKRAAEQRAKDRALAEQAGSSVAAPGPETQEKDSRRWIVSDDGKYIWDGTAWQPRTISPDGNYIWDGAAWQLRTPHEGDDEERAADQRPKGQASAEQAAKTPAATLDKQQHASRAAKAQRTVPMDEKSPSRSTKAQEGRDLKAGVGNTQAAEVEARTNELVDAYRKARRDVDKSFFFERAAAVVYLVDSSGAAYSALIQRHDVPGALASLKAVHDAFAADDMLRKANTWRKTVFAITSTLFGISGISVLVVGIEIIGKAAAAGQGIVAAGGSGMLIIAAASAIKGGYDTFVDHKPSATEVTLHPVEKRYFEVVGGSPPTVGRVELLRVAGVLAVVCASFAFELVILGLLYGWIQGHSPPPLPPFPSYPFFTPSPG
jgi:hypothetical protein